MNKFKENEKKKKGIILIRLLIIIINVQLFLFYLMALKTQIHIKKIPISKASKHLIV